MRRIALLALAALASGCGGDDAASPPATTRVEPPPPLVYSVVQDFDSVPAWLRGIKPQRGLGRWQSAMPSPDGKTLLAQWTAECEIPAAYFVPLHSRKPRAVEPSGVESVAVAWDDDGRAGVFFAGGACGTADSRPGLYLVSLDGEREFVTDDLDEVARWQAERRSP